MRTKKYIIISIIMVVMVGTVSLYRHNKYNFTVDKWNSISINERQSLARDFIKKYGNKNLSKNNIIDMLGFDVESYLGFPVRHKTSSNLVYDFGGKRTYFASGNIAMIIEFDENDTAVSYDIVEYSW
ncbi:MAG: hypothetical protein PHZ09_02885 [Eubacteriales bacterium]|jgi:hypothetical protein|nr:hypothetical protein [Eubacteriales bacterium]